MSVIQLDSYKLEVGDLVEVIDEAYDCTMKAIVHSLESEEKDWVWVTCVQGTEPIKLYVNRKDCRKLNQNRYYID